MNRFDDKAATWDDDPAKIERARVVAEVIRRTIALDGSERLLEYGAGTGLVSQALRDDVGPVTLADTSTGMREVMLAKIASGALPDARVWDLDLENAGPPDERFDLVVTVLTLHHIHDVDVVLSRFTEVLDDGGHLCIVDLDEEDGSFHDAGMDVHHGFERSKLAASMATAGFADVEFRDCHHMDRSGANFPMFLATGRRA